MLTLSGIPYSLNKYAQIGSFVITFELFSLHALYKTYLCYSYKHKNLSSLCKYNMLSNCFLTYMLLCIQLSFYSNCAATTLNSFSSSPNDISVMIILIKDWNVKYKFIIIVENVKVNSYITERSYFISISFT
ncbi:hypothetical protein PGO_000055 [Plasmodium gonderi]|uniref:Uncharacterized protein n=1 Tax=Plasmodium gonderi TaxID=77519 RepID=A0A1Y1JNS4_PLAGO|nr:hypothetical protein PGO_000055 [Plasmodium gonderi]GAW83910.1 hypothetical protein PGO_000055 [Plasmodium gonderi]